MDFRIEFEQEVDDRWIAEIVDLPGVMAYGATRHDAESKVQAIALRVIADRIEREKTTMNKFSSPLRELVAGFQGPQGAPGAEADRLA
jgi:predicted RNase H-like HicB family nuclease